jgi:hypothetical protein
MTVSFLEDNKQRKFADRHTDMQAEARRNRMTRRQEDGKTETQEER